MGQRVAFQPLRSLQPVSPVETERDYKRGGDGASWVMNGGERYGDIEVVSLFRRDETSDRMPNRFDARLTMTF
jgi:hypothetical protein